MNEMTALPACRARGRVPHNLIERRYRDNLNSQIDNLKQLIPTVSDDAIAAAELEDGGQDLVW